MDIKLGPEWKYCVKLHREDWDDIQTWCKETLGEFDDTWYKLGIDPVDSIFNQDRETETVWYFRYEKDAMIFKLRWS